MRKSLDSLRIISTELRLNGESLLRLARCDEVRVEVICLFIARRYKQGLRGTQVTVVLSEIRHIFIISGVCSSFSDDERESASRKDYALRTVDLRYIREAQTDHSALPKPHEIQSVIRETDWMGLGSSTASDLDKIAAYLRNFRDDVESGLLHTEGAS